MSKVTIKLVTDRGFGFINTVEGKEIFFHRNGVEGVEFFHLRVGQEVEFEMGLDKKGRPQAVKVTLVGNKAPEPIDSRSK